MPPLEAVVFDVNETMFALAGLEPRFRALGLDPSAVPLWFARVLRDGFALTAAGGYAPFPEIAAAALRQLRPGLTEEDAQQVLAGFAELEPHPDVAPALRRLAAAGVSVVTLTVGSAGNTKALLARSGLGAYVADTLSVDTVQRWKPAPEPYRYAAEVCAVAPHQMALVACHPWDVNGAASAGLRTAFVPRAERMFPAYFAAPDVVGDDLEEVARRLLGPA